MTSIETITQECDRVLALAEKATPGPWHEDAKHCGFFNEENGTPLGQVFDNPDDGLSPIDDEESDNNLRLILLLPTSLPALARALKIAVGTLQEIYQDDARNNADSASDRAYDTLAAVAKEMSK